MAKRKTLPDHILLDISRQNIWRWRNEPDDKYFGNELSNIETIEAFAENISAQIVFRKYLRIIKTFQDIALSCKDFKQNLHEKKEKVVKEVLKIRKYIDVKNAVRIFSIKPATFYSWKDQILKKCESSDISLCKKIYPNQLTTKEVACMKKLFFSERFKYWPVYSIATWAARNRLLFIAYSTWCKYIHLMEWKKSLPPKKSRNFSTIKADAPNKIWHADITILTTESGKKCFIYLLMDSFSRLILSWRVAEKVCKNIRLETIKEAYETYAKPNQDIALIVDGGVENNNTVMDEYCSSDTVSIKKLIAKKDIMLTNNIIEAGNKLLKYRYLFQKSYFLPKDVESDLSWIIADYNYERPHVSLKGATPFEAHTGIIRNNNEIEVLMGQARTKRLIENRKNLCGICD